MSAFHRRPRTAFGSHSRTSSTLTDTSSSTHASSTTHENINTTTNTTATAGRGKKLNSLPWRLPRSQKSTNSFLRPAPAEETPSEATHGKDCEGFVFAPTAARRPALEQLFPSSQTIVPSAPPPTRPRSFASSVHSTSSLAADSIRRRSILLDDSPFNASLQRATDVLRASERGRMEHGRREERREEVEREERLRRSRSQELLSTSFGRARPNFASVREAERPRTYHMGNLLRPEPYAGPWSSQESVGLPHHLPLPEEPMSKFSASTGKMSYASPAKISKGKKVRNEKSFRNLLAIHKPGSALSLRGLLGAKSKQDEPLLNLRESQGVTPSLPTLRHHAHSQSTSSATPSSRPSSAFSSSKESSAHSHAPSTSASASTASKSLLSKWSSAIKGKRVRKQVERFEGYRVASAPNSQERELPLHEGSPMVVRLAEKVQVSPTQAKRVASGQRPSRIPLSAVFPNASLKSTEPPSRPAPAPPLEISPHARPGKPTTSLPRRSLKAKRTTSAPTLPGRNLELSITSAALSGQRSTFIQPKEAPPVPATMHVPATGTALLLPAATIRPSTSDSFLRGKMASFSTDEDGTSSLEGDLLNPRRLTPPSPSPNRNSWRSPSPARFRDLLPSKSASSSPEKNELDLPVPSSSARSSVESGFDGKRGRKSPKRCALGPEQLIAMASPEEEGEIVEVSCATSDLAELLSGLEENDTADLGSVELLSSEEEPIEQVQADADLSASLRRRLPKLSESASDISDVPEDLQEMIRAVKDHLHDLPYSMPSPPHALLSNESSSPEGPSNTLLIPTVYNGGLSPLTADTTTFPSASGSDTLFGRRSCGDSTVDSFEGCASTAAGALRAMLRGPDAPSRTLTEEVEAQVERDIHLAEVYAQEQVEESYGASARLRESAREALDVARPSVGDQMWQGMESVPSSPEETRPMIVQRRAVFTSHSHNVSLASSSEFSMDSSATDSYASHGSPLAGKTRGSLTRRGSLARYSARRPTAELGFARRTKASLAEQEGAVIAEIEAEEDESEEGHRAGEDDTAFSLAQSVLSVSSRDPHGSPCPVTKGRYPMLTAHRLSSTPSAAPALRFPLARMPVPTAPASRAGTVAAIAEESSPPRVEHTTPPRPMSSTPAVEEAQEASPFKRVFSPLEQFKSKSRIPPPTTALATNPHRSPVRAASISPRFVRPLSLSRPGENVPIPRPFEEAEMDGALIPPDTPPPSSPSTSTSSPTNSLLVAVTESGTGLVVEFTPHELDTIEESSQRSSVASSLADVAPQAIVDYFTAQHAEDPLSRFADETFSDDSSSGASSSEDEGRIVVGEESDSDSSDILAPLPAPETFSLTYHPLALPLHPLPASPHVLEVQVEDEPYDPWELDDELCHGPSWRKWHEFYDEASYALAESKRLWPDTDYSRAVMAEWESPTNVHGMLEFLFASQNAWLVRPVVLSPETSGLLAPLGDHSPESSELLERIEAELNRQSDSSDSHYPARRSAAFGYLHKNLDISPPTSAVELNVFDAPAPRGVLARKPLNNGRVANLARSASSPVKDSFNPSPFTALPPKLNLGSKLRGVRAKLHARLSPEKSTPPSAKENVPYGVELTFLGDQATHRRKNQYDAALRKLEGLGTPEEQREEGDSEGDESGVFEARGEGAQEWFAKTPRLSTSRPRVRPRTKLSKLR